MCSLFPVYEKYHMLHHVIPVHHLIVFKKLPLPFLLFLRMFLVCPRKQKRHTRNVLQSGQMYLGLEPSDSLDSLKLLPPLLYHDGNTC